ncbi:serine hydrolase domain-containing protein [Archangium violaceum]|uniref:serine hydrolase domain-containing protein n=1 Tax=Archangium violaceum TaxID=83451 RepID=UPI002B2FCDFA|nr:serine hydrolase domain-containing protein [Archangium gephyra]
MSSLAAVSLVGIVAVQFLGAYGAAPSTASPPASAPIAVAAPPAPAVAAAPAGGAPRVLDADTPATTRAGHRFIAPAGWSLRVAGTATILESPEGGSWVAFVDTEGVAEDAALAAAWAAFPPGGPRALRSSTAEPNRDGWRDQRTHTYQTSPDERRTVTARTMRHGERWTVRIADLANTVASKREAQIKLLFEELLPSGYVRETFAGRTAHKLDASRLAVLTGFITRAQRTLEVPGVSIGIVQDGKVVLAAGFGVREHGKPEPVDADTRYLVASNTKSLTTLMLGKLVDEGKLTWETPVATALPAFVLGDAETTRSVQIKHLVCACTGLPRLDVEWLMGPERAPATLTLEILARMRPTSKFGEMYQYSNPIAAAAGLVGGHVAFPALELGAAYDRAMQTRVFGPLGMARTTLDFAIATRGNYARPHAFDHEGKLARVDMAHNLPIRAVRPAGGAWSTVNDLLAYVQMELARGTLRDGRRYISEGVLAARQAEQVRTGKASWYGMGLDVDTSWGTPMVFHGGRMRGYRTNMVWFPEHGVGAVVLTNADSGNVLMDAFPRRLAEVLFDGNPEADDAVAAAAAATRVSLAASRQLLEIPASAQVLAGLAARYRNDVLGEIRVRRTAAGGELELRSVRRAPLAARANPDGTTTIVGLSPGWSPELLVGTRDGRSTLTLRAGQHEYVFRELD